TGVGRNPGDAVAAKGGHVEIRAARAKGNRRRLRQGIRFVQQREIRRIVTWVEVKIGDRATRDIDPTEPIAYKETAQARLKVCQIPRIGVRHDQIAATWLYRQ